MVLDFFESLGLGDSDHLVLISAHWRQRCWVLIWSRVRRLWMSCLKPLSVLLSWGQVESVQSASAWPSKDLLHWTFDDEYLFMFQNPSSDLHLSLSSLIEYCTWSLSQLAEGKKVVWPHAWNLLVSFTVQGISSESLLSVDSTMLDVMLLQVIIWILARHGVLILVQRARSFKPWFVAYDGFGLWLSLSLQVWFFDVVLPNS